MSSESSAKHRSRAASRGPVAVAIVTVSDTRTAHTDTNAAYLRERIAAAGHRVADIRRVRDEPVEIETVLEELAQSDCQVILINGGTGIARRDRTFDVVSRKLEKTLSGFGELFRMLSYEQVGAAAMMSRAVAGVCAGKVIVSTPGSPAAVRLAWERLLEPELAHMVWELTR